MTVIDEDEVFMEGCPDCGQDTVVEADDGESVYCTACGWRE